MKKSIALVMMAVLLVAASVMGTLAFLTSTDSVKNTFTVGKVAITLDEAKVNVYGEVDASVANRVKGNTYKLIPGHEYTKDPIVHLASDSEACWLFVKVDNGIAAIEADTKIAEQITTNGWTALAGETGVYYRKVNATDAAAGNDYEVFGSFKLTDDAKVENYATANVTVTAYAIQADGFTSAAAAWTEVSK